MDGYWAVGPAETRYCPMCNKSVNATYLKCSSCGNVTYGYNCNNCGFSSGPSRCTATVTKSCTSCSGTGKKTSDCSSCLGKGKWVETRQCSACFGEGRVNHPSTCGSCSGRGYHYGTSNCSHNRYSSHYYCTHGNYSTSYHD